MPAKIVDYNALSWPELQHLAETAGIPASDTRLHIIAALEAQQAAMHVEAAEEDLKRVSLQMSHLEAFTVTALRSDDGEAKEVAVRDPRQEIYAAILLAFGWDQDDRRGRSEMGVWFGEIAVTEGETFEDHDIQDGARLTVSLPAERRRATVREVAEEVARLNPGIDVEELMRRVRGKVDPEDPSRVTGDIYWGGMGISELPGIIGDLTIRGSLLLINNRLRSLPEGFGSLTIGGVLLLYGNPITDSLRTDSFDGIRLVLK